MTSEGKMVAFWLLPATRERGFFAALIRQMAEQFDAPIFEPHVTLHAGAMTETRATQVLDTLASRLPLHLEVEGVAFSKEFTKTLFVRLGATAEAGQLSAEITEAAGPGADYHFDPHMSLIYGGVSREEKDALARTIEIPLRSVTFDALRAITTPASIETRADVEAWRTLSVRQL